MHFRISFPSTLFTLLCIQVKETYLIIKVKTSTFLVEGYITVITVVILWIGDATSWYA